MSFTQENTAKDIETAPVYFQASKTEPSDLTPSEAFRLGNECFESSTDWINTSRRSQWADSLRAFQGLHPNGSKYLSGDYSYRSRLFRPKTRAMVRRAEADTASAFFANEDVVSILAQDDNDKNQQASAKIMERLLQFRLTKTIPWFQTLLGARQDAEINGICIAKAYWKYSERRVGTETRVAQDETGMPYMDGDQLAMETIDIYEKVDDKPWVDLIPPENFRFDPGADWRDPVATSPYLIELIPMYLADIKQRIEDKEWLPVSDSEILASRNTEDETTRHAREQNRVPGKDTQATPRDYEICWVRANIIRWRGEDWHFYSLNGVGTLLTEPKKLAEIYPYFQGDRPYVAGNILIEAHKTHPSGKVELIKDLQTQTNDITNLRLDNVKLSLMPRQFIKGGQGLDPNDMRVFKPGKTVVTTGKDDPRNVILWDRPPDVTSSSFQEQDRLNLDFEELTGGFSNSSIQGNRQVYEAVGNMELMAGNGSKIDEYDQRVFSETFVEKLIRLLVKMEQACETDPVVLAIAGTEAQLWQKFGINEITDDLLRQELTIRVNVGIGATNPQTRLQNFLTASKAVGELYGPAAAMASNPEEVVSEIFALCGYKDGKRFFKEGMDFSALMNQPNPEQAKAEAEMKIAQAEQEAQAKQDILNHQMETKQRQLEHQYKQQEMQMQFYFKMQELLAKNKTEVDKHKMTTEAVSKPSAVIQVDGRDALDGIGRNIAQMVASHGDSLSNLAGALSPLAQAHVDNGRSIETMMGGLTQAIERLAKVSAAPRKLVKDKDGTKRTVLELNE